MAILFNAQTRTFHLYNHSVSYIFRVMENEQLEQLYYGSRIAEESSYDLYHEEVMRSQMSICVPEPSLLSMQYTRQEYPCFGTGDYRSPAMAVLQENGSRITDFRYVSHEIAEGKPSLLPLPATYTESDAEAQTLSVTLHDDVMDTDLILFYTIYEAYPVITRSVKFVHHGAAPIILDRAMSMSAEWSDKNFTMVSLAGGWARERYVKERPLEAGITAVHSLTGTCSSAEHNPFLALKRPGATEETGEVYGFSLLYSGNFLAQAEVSTFDMTRVMMGINPEGFCWELKSGESFQTPEVVMVYSSEGLGGMSRTFHRLYRTRLMRGRCPQQRRSRLIALGIICTTPTMATSPSRLSTACASELPTRVLRSSSGSGAPKTRTVWGVPTGTVSRSRLRGVRRRSRGSHASMTSTMCPRDRFTTLSLRLPCMCSLFPSSISHAQMKLT